MMDQKLFTINHNNDGNINEKKNPRQKNWLDFWAELRSFASKILLSVDFSVIESGEISSKFT